MLKGLHSKQYRVIYPHTPSTPICAHMMVMATTMVGNTISRRLDLLMKKWYLLLNASIVYQTSQNCLSL
jgi:hypothetical protein